jgi:curved DNA-binding protein CbpA
MAAVEKFRQLLKIIETKNYYDILRVKRDADPAAIKLAFHNFALSCHPDRAPEGNEELAMLAAEIFKRGVESYRVLSQAELRVKYDKGLAKGRIRFDEQKLDTVPPGPKVETLESLAETPRGKQFALKADRLLVAGKTEEARIQLTTALQNEPDNEPLQARLRKLWEA